ncbi:ABC transporter substrate-binding protein [Aeromicrobium massiliense]|uniref:ABC transporter substrate-binding protein n=1 Tax=Aeromicrobium massiliense TaxID=1464554 RepID=UPI000312D692|nr:iron-siderophore ABC transporter substrate-binding protein [Aeromicrobium massiliense]
MNNRLVRAAVAAVTLPALLAACGTTDAEDDAKPAASTSESCSDDSTTTSTEPVSLTDSFGRKVELDKPAERVAVLEWQQTEDVLSLCVNPVAVSDGKGFTLWDEAEKLPAEYTEIGTRGEPNLNALYGANPDLIIIEAYTAEDEIIKQLEKQDVPVLATKGADGADPIKQMNATFDLIAQATGREERAEVVKADFEDTLAEGKKALADLDAADKKFVYFDGYAQGGNVSLRPFGQGSLMGEVGEALGLENAWTGEVDPAYGLGQTDVEGMTAVGDANLFYTGTEDPESEDINELLQKNDIWTSLPAVEEDRAYAFPSGIWTFGGPRSAEAIVDAYVDLLTD